VDKEERDTNLSEELDERESTKEKGKSTAGGKQVFGSLTDKMVE
jgi:hypothetical protein